MKKKLTTQQPTTNNQQPAITLRKAHLEDFEEIYDIVCHALDDGTTYSYTREEMTPERSLAYFMTAPGTHCYVAETKKGEVVAFYTIRPNRTGRGGHVANASFLVHHAHRSKGLGRLISSHALKTAKKLGYKAMQFNFVVSTNEAAVTLYQSLGFRIVGTLPKVFNHSKKGLVDVHIMHRFLQ